MASVRVGRAERVGWRRAGEGRKSSLQHHRLQQMREIIHFSPVISAGLWNAFRQLHYRCKLERRHTQKSPPPFHTHTGLLWNRIFYFWSSTFVAHDRPLQMFIFLNSLRLFFLKFAFFWIKSADALFFHHYSRHVDAVVWSTSCICCIVHAREIEIWVGGWVFFSTFNLRTWERTYEMMYPVVAGYLHLLGTRVPVLL